jgi:hypothetical protein
MEVEEHEVDLSNGAQLTEKYLVEINPKGQVGIPLSAKASIHHPLPDGMRRD